MTGDMWNTILFDLDGTLTDSQEGIINSALYALNYFGIQEKREKIINFIGPPLYETFRETYGFDPERTRIGTDKFHEYFDHRGWRENEVYSGVENLLKELKTAGKRLFVATSKPEWSAVRILEHFGLAQYFDHISGAPKDENGGTKAQVIANALSYLDNDNHNEIVMVGDRKHDVSGAHEMGLPVVGVLYGYGDREELEAAGADFIAKDVDELKTLLLRKE